MKWTRLLGFLVLAFAAGLPAWADMYGFTNITHNNASDAAAGEAQLSFNVSDLGGGLIQFEFLNVGQLLMSITDIYFDDNKHDTFANISAITNGSGVSFSVGARPRDLPGGNAVNFETTPGLSADSNSPVQSNGVNPGEFVRLRLALKQGLTFADVIARLNSAALRVGIHVQGFDCGGSESFVNNPGPPPVPAPAAALLGAVGLIVARRWRESI
ncbi:MAG: hypothetical protein CHACPFDD_00644 [Phycisphaerae bacterium]|nr:hypothetical protein [Phycisphaerae bacterium]